MPQSLILKGYGQLKKVYSGNVAGKPRGLLPNTVPLTAFYYEHTLLRTIGLSQGLFSVGSEGGFWTFQFRESGAPGAKILFEQSVLINATLFGAFGDVITGWYIHSLYTYKFKTRICDGQYVPVAIEPDQPENELTDPAPPLPARPAVPNLHNVRVTSLSIAMPPLPERADTLALLVSNERAGEYAEVQSGLAPGQVISVDVGDLGFHSVNHGVAATELPWWRVRADGPGGSTLGPAMRDIWTHTQNDGTQDTGYKGYLFADSDRATGFYEQSLILNTSAFGGNFAVQLGADWYSPAYRCALPSGAFMEIISDAWVGQLSDNDIYYSIAYKEGGVKPVSLFDRRVGTLWTLGVRDGQVQCTRSRKLENHDFGVDGGIVLPGTATTYLGLLRWGATLYCVVHVDGSVKLVESIEESLLWKDPLVITTDVTVLGHQISRDGATVYIVGKAGATNGDITAGDLVRVIVRLEKDGVKVTKETIKSTLPENQVAGLLRDGSTLYYVSADSDGIRIFQSTDEMVTWTELNASEN